MAYCFSGGAAECVNTQQEVKFHENWSGFNNSFQVTDTLI